MTSSEGKELMANSPIDTLCMATKDEKCNFKPMKFQRRPMGARDVVIEMKYCGVCHTDLHHAANHLGNAVYPTVPGHELAGVVSACGPDVEKLKVGMHVGVGCMVDSCLSCKACKAGDQHKCMKQVATYGGTDRSGRAATYPVGEKTLGGYTSVMVCDERFVIIIPDEFPLEYAGPVMCAGVTMLDPLKQYEAKDGSRVGIIGLGGLGLMGVKIAKARGCIVTVISRSPKKEEIAKKFGAETFLISTSKEQMQAGRKSLDLIINTVPTFHDYLAYNSLLAKNGKQIILGMHKGFVAALASDALASGCSKIAHSGIGSIETTQEIIDFCHEHKIYPEIEVVPVQKLNHVYQMLEESNASAIRYVLDIAGSLTDGVEESKDWTPPPKLSPCSGSIQPGCGMLCHVFSVICCCRCCC